MSLLELATSSIEKQKELEQKDDISFDEFLESYNRS